MTKKTEKNDPFKGEALQGQQHLRIVIVGHVDHGKSTMIGRLMYDTGSFMDGKLAELEKVSARRGVDGIEWSFLLDAFQAERDQNITIDTTQIWLKTDRRETVIIDAPGHREFLKNMISGAAAADAAILVVDASEGVQEQTRRHAYLLHLLGLKQVAVALNKMDLVKFDSERFQEVSRDITKYLASIGLTPAHIVPLSARHGDMIATRGENLPWYQGKTLLEVFDSFEVAMPPVALPLRFPVQDVYRYDNKAKERIIVGRVETGILRKGDKILFSPTNETATVTSLEIWPENKAKVEAHAGESVGITIDQKIFVERGHIGSHEKNPPLLSNVFRANIFWLAEKSIRVGNTYKVRYGTHEAMVSVQSVDRVIDTQDLAQDDQSKNVSRNMVAEVTFRARDLLPVDDHGTNPRTGRLVIYDGYDVAGGGTLSMEGYHDQRQTVTPKAQNLHVVSHLLDRDGRAQRSGHYGGVFWFTGLSGAGKSTLAMAVERVLFDKGYHTYVLDGDNVRHGLNADLGFSPEDRAENIRRVGEVAALMFDAGQIVITSFISPYRSDRERARKAAPGHFHEIYVQADLKTCEGRDPKGLYKKAREGKIKDFTGIDSPYEAPENPEMVVNTQGNDIDTCVAQVVRYIEECVKLPASVSRSARGKVQAV
jgi:bifunctional enzyme CysN/CysC